MSADYRYSKQLLRWFLFLSQPARKRLVPWYYDKPAMIIKESGVHADRVLWLEKMPEGRNSEGGGCQPQILRRRLMPLIRKRRILWED